MRYQGQEVLDECTAAATGSVLACKRERSQADRIFSKLEKSGERHAWTARHSYAQGWISSRRRLWPGATRSGKLFTSFYLTSPCLEAFHGGSGSCAFALHLPDFPDVR